MAAIHHTFGIENDRYAFNKVVSLLHVILPWMPQNVLRGLTGLTGL
jgi:hypothetical protein